MSLVGLHVHVHLHNLTEYWHLDLITYVRENALNGTWTLFHSQVYCRPPERGGVSLPWWTGCNVLAAAPNVCQGTKLLCCQPHAWIISR